MAERRRTPLIAALLLVVGGCTQPVMRPTAAADNTLPPTPLLPPSSLGQARQVEQRLSGAYGDQNFELRCVVLVSADRLLLIGLMPWGQTAFELNYDGETITAKSALLPQDFDPARLAADLQLALWPLERLEPVYREAGWSLSEPAPGVRRLRRDGAIVAEVHYADDDPWNGRLWLVNLRYGYTLAVDSHALPSD